MQKSAWLDHQAHPPISENGAWLIVQLSTWRTKPFRTPGGINLYPEVQVLVSLNISTHFTTILLKIKPDSWTFCRSPLHSLSERFLKYVKSLLADLQKHTENDCVDILKTWGWRTSEHGINHKPRALQGWLSTPKCKKKILQQMALHLLFLK